MTCAIPAPTPCSVQRQTINSSTPRRALTGPAGGARRQARESLFNLGAGARALGEVHQEVMCTQQLERLAHGHL